MRNIFPSEITNLTIESHFSKFSNKSHLIYVAILLILIGVVVSLFLIKTEITIQSIGLLRSSSEPIQINSPLLNDYIVWVYKGYWILLLLYNAYTIRHCSSGGKHWDNR